MSFVFPKNIDTGSKNPVIQGEISSDLGNLIIYDETPRKGKLNLSVSNNNILPVILDDTLILDISNI